MVMHVASIDGISQEVYEAASIDGATGVQKFFRITIPLLRRSIGTTYILSLSGTINLSFTLSNVMTGGGPNGASSVLYNICIPRACEMRILDMRWRLQCLLLH